jgi:hypothetical protein
MENSPYVSVKVDQFAFAGRFQIGLIQGEFEGRFDGKRVLFSLEAFDVLEPVHGAGTMSLLDGMMAFRLLFFRGEVFAFLCEHT